MNDDGHLRNQQLAPVLGARVEGSPDSESGAVGWAGFTDDRRTIQSGCLNGSVP